MHLLAVIEFTRDLLVDLGGWSVLKEARSLVERQAIKQLKWEQKTLKGEVLTGGTTYYPRLNLRSITFAENRCNCITGKKGMICPHAIALCLVEMDGGLQNKDDTKEEIQEPEKQTEIKPLKRKIKTLVLSEEKGLPARFRVLLPPNLHVSAPKDRIIVKVEFELANGELVLPESIDRGRAYKLDKKQQLLGGEIEHLCGDKLHGLMQLKREQLLKLLQVIKDEPNVFWINKPQEAISWSDNTLEGVHQHLQIAPTEESTPQAKIEKKSPKKPIQRAIRFDEDRSGKSKLVVDGSTNFLSIQLPSREDASYFPILDLVKDNGFKLEPSNGKWWLRDKHKTLNFLSDYYQELKTRFRAAFSDNFESRLKGLTELGVETSVTELGNEFEVQVSLSGKIEQNRLREELSRGRRYIEKEGQVLLINKSKLDELNEISAKISGEKDRAWNTSIRLKAKPWELCDLENILGDIETGFVPPETWKERSSALKNLSKLEEAPVELSLNKILRLYQKIGVAWLYHLYRNSLGGILADEMGLGKTIQAIGLIGVIKETKDEPALIVCPAGLVGNWARELQRFASNLKIYCHHGNKRLKSSDDWSQFDAIITSYSTLSRDEELFYDHNFSITFADEAQHIKNRRTQHAKSLKRLQTQGRFLLTGTPIENSINDLVSLFEFLLPGYLDKPHGQLNADDRAWYQQRIKERSAPYILRRTKKQVAPELPEKIEQTIFCDMTAKQKDLYEKTRRRCAEHLGKLEEKGASEGQLKMAVFTELLRLRQVCADPRLIDNDLKTIHSSKYEVFSEILDESIDGGHRILVFSQFVSLLTLLKNELEKSGTPYCYIDGKTKDRLKEADRFNENEEIPVFLISLKAGGTGLNLTGADTVIHYDPWWNPAAEAQATDRAHRIGQEKVVTSLKLIVTGSVEERVQTMQSEKRKLLDDLFDESQASLGKLQLSDMKSLIFDEETDEKST